MNKSVFLLSPIEQFEIMPIIALKLGWFDISITNHTIVILVIISALFVLRGGMLSPRDHSHFIIPFRMQYIFEIYLKGILSLVFERLGRKEGLFYFPLILTLSFYMLCLNLSGLVPHTGALLSHVVITLTISGSFCMGMTFACLNRFGLRFFRLILPPNTDFGVSLILVPVEALSYVCRPLSLATRVFANCLGGHTLVKIVSGCAWSLLNISGYSFVINGFSLLILAPLMMLETTVAIIQSSVFVTLICIYMGETFDLE